jgi:kynureninase
MIGRIRLVRRRGKRRRRGAGIMYAMNPTEYRGDEAFAREQDAADPLARFRDRFHIPRHAGHDAIYFAGNSLGLQPKSARAIVDQELADWAELGIDAHFRGKRPWYPYHEQLREPGARLVGALPHEVVWMNGLTVNLHLMMVSFYRPTRERHKILIEETAFPSDTYAARTQLAWHGFDPTEGLIRLCPRAGEHALRIEDIEEVLEREGRRIAVALLPGVNYFTGQVFDIARLTKRAHEHGCIAGWDLAHAAGNVALKLHEWGVDFAVWCSYKYLNAGPGALAGCYVHERHARDTSLRRFGGWWGNDPATRFRMHLEPEFKPVPAADAWQLSNPPILSAAPLVASLAIFDEATIPALRGKSVRLTGYLQYLLDEMTTRRYEVITPREPAERGCQLSILVHDHPRGLHEELVAAGVVCDFREPNVVRVAPTPLYNTFHDVWRFADVLKRHV